MIFNFHEWQIHEILLMLWVKSTFVPKILISTGNNMCRARFLLRLTEYTKERKKIISRKFYHLQLYLIPFSFWLEVDTFDAASLSSRSLFLQAAFDFWIALNKHTTRSSRKVMIERKRKLSKSEKREKWICRYSPLLRRFIEFFARLASVE